MRVEAGLSQAELALKAGISRATIQLIEYGRTITPRSLRALAAVLGDITLPADRITTVEQELAALREKFDALTGQGAA